MSRDIKDNLQKAAVYVSAGFTVIILLVIIGFIVIKGMPGINLHFLTSSYDDKTTYVTVESRAEMSKIVEGDVAELGITLQANEKGELAITKMEKNSPLKNGRNSKEEKYPAKKGRSDHKSGETGRFHPAAENRPSRRRDRADDGHHDLYDFAFLAGCSTGQHYGCDLSDRVCKAGEADDGHSFCD